MENWYKLPLLTASFNLAQLCIRVNNVLLSISPIPFRERFGFRDGDRGTHTTRTLMLAELRLLLDGNPVAATKSDYRTSIINNNILGKPTQSTRQETAQRLSQLYGLDLSVTVFRLLRFFWTLDHQSQPLLALLCAMARDPLLRITVDPILQAAPGQLTGKQEIERVVAQVTLNRFSPSTLSSVARNASSSWTQSGHLTGRRKKIRTQPVVTVGSVAYAMALGYLEGDRGQLLFETLWMKLLGIPTSKAITLVIEASRRGWLDYRGVGSIVEVRFPELLTSEEQKWLQNGTGS